MKVNLVDSVKIKLQVYLNYVILLVSLLLIISLFRNITKIRKANIDIKTKEKELEKLQEVQQKLKVEVENAKSEEFIEAQLRNKLNLAREGEIVIVLPPDEILAKYAPKPEVTDAKLPDPNWKKWAKLFGMF